MAKKILNAATFGLAGLLVGGKKKAAPAATTAASTAASGRPKPIITQLGAGGPAMLPRRTAVNATLLSGLSSKLGS